MLRQILDGFVAQVCCSLNLIIFILNLTKGLLSATQMLEVRRKESRSAGYDYFGVILRFTLLMLLIECDFTRLGGLHG